MHIAHFRCGETISALGREPQIIQMSAMSSCARREAGTFGERQLCDKPEFSEPCPAEQFTGVRSGSQFSVQVDFKHFALLAEGLSHSILVLSEMTENTLNINTEESGPSQSKCMSLLVSW